ncbi:hypothetical protein AJ79_03625 [Helicocarpus griseus UAMH5409]|uniref:Uncharacterized protein n=1 Tax=Helicocarpus griseus UAMH5409 TaxID=1447875 RepID=A0A2B7XX35_9EURO|nr:hypothetical protein AJ79_03625 [Helicocarpus griseus UAMH5409]
MTGFFRGYWNTENTSKSPNVHVPQNPDSTTVKGHKLRRFPARGIAIILGPLLVTAYFIIIWAFIEKRERDTIKYGLNGELWVFYSWFIVGVFGLNLSKYGLQGVEAAMLQTRTWQARNSMALMMHSGSTWSGPGGWVKYFNALYQRKRLAGRLWWLLAILSALSSIALPLSGLTMDIDDGYIRLDEEPMVIGRKWDNLNRFRGYFRPLSQTLWQAGDSPNLPGIGVAYTAPHVQRDKFGLGDFPNPLPTESAENPDIFLVPQATVPIGGKSWGMLIGYNCSIVESFSEFKILSRRLSAKYEYNWNDRYDFPLFSLGPDEAILVRNSTDTAEVGDAGMWANLEIGVKPYTVNKNIPNRGYTSEFLAAQANGTLRSQIIEIALWQAAFNSLDFNGSPGAMIAGAPVPFFEDENGKIHHNKSFFPAIYNRGGFQRLNDRKVRSLAVPVGVRCVSHSNLGTAELDPQGFFRTFEQGLPPPKAYRGDESSGVFGQTALDFLQTKVGNLITSSGFRSVPAEYISRSRYLSADALRKSCLLAFARDALSLMYDDSNEFGQNAYPLSDATSSKPGKILTPGRVPGIIPAVFFVLWALGCIVLGIIYGFSARWSETLDGYSLFRFGADLSDQIRGRPEFAGPGEFYKCDGLWRLPGLIGDSQPRSDTGHISLVEQGSEVDRGKRYH